MLKPKALSGKSGRREASTPTPSTTLTVPGANENAKQALAISAVKNLVFAGAEATSDGSFLLRLPLLILLPCHIPLTLELHIPTPIPESISTSISNNPAAASLVASSIQAKITSAATDTAPTNSSRLTFTSISISTPIPSMLV
ncbi:hypothetical protein VKT23_012193 [Stygiomarasmius scandens]|uniref:Uncharacterized protein n=1 Tax=Marasmiellus scandens TaxID=2682957 RepID=A0ABR1JB74_9AGAR